MNERDGESATEGDKPKPAHEERLKVGGACGSSGRNWDEIRTNKLHHS